MKVIYENPNNTLKYYRWCDNNGAHDIWYEKTTDIYDYKDMDIPKELVAFLDKWTAKIEEYKKNYIEIYPVKLSEIMFIYKDIVYSIHPSTVSATYRTNFGKGDEYYDVSWHSLFEEYEREIRDDLKKVLGVKYSRYIGFLD